MNRFVVAACAFVLSIAGALAHSSLQSSNPADGATLTTPPRAIDLTFSEPTRVMKVEMTYVSGDDSRSVALDVPSRDEVETLTLAPRFMGAGTYRIDWRALSQDGHVVTGRFSFTITGE